MEREPKQGIKFEVGDRVKAWFHGRWWPGAVVEIGLRPVKKSRRFFDSIYRRGGDPNVEIIHEDEEFVTFLFKGRKDAWMYILTDEKVDDDPSALFGGFGLSGPTRGGLTILEDEPEPDTSDPIFRKR